MRENHKVDDSCTDFMKGPQQVTEGEAVTRCAAVPRHPTPLTVVWTLSAFLLSSRYILHTYITHTWKPWPCVHKWQLWTSYHEIWKSLRMMGKIFPNEKFSFNRTFGWINGSNWKELLVWNLLWIPSYGGKGGLETWCRGWDACYFYGGPRFGSQQ